MENRLVVATTCPTCSAPLNFAEGSHAVQCSYCRSHLLVTGHNQVLSFAIAPKVALEDAVAQVMQAHAEHDTPCRVINPQLYFIPYYRLTGHDLRWTQERRPTDLQALPDPLLQSIMAHSEARWSKRTRTKLSMSDRYVEKSFMACPLPATGLHSLGVRPAVLRLELFHHQHLASHGTIVPVGMTPRQALAQGMKTVQSQDLVMRQVLGRMLSLIYFPYWMVEVEGAGQPALTIVDAVASKVMTRDASCSLQSVVSRQATSAPQIIGFRPLMCPNCGWDLPLRTDDTVFFCTSCESAWQLSGSELRTVTYQVARIPTLDSQTTLTYLPFWVLQPKAICRHFASYFLPAFRYRRLKVIADLACKWTRKQPHYEVLTGPKPPLQSCFYTQGDAVKLAHFIHVGLTTARPQKGLRAASSQLSFARAILTWFPFMVRGRYLIDPFTGLDLQRSAVL
jgi:DNA-directed RNA polymerase subunit RPC12/RpoP